MELDELIPFKHKPDLCDWIVKGDYLMYKKLEHLPAAFIEDDIVYIFLDNRIPRQIVKLVKWVMKFGCDFYLVSPEMSSPSNNVDEEKIILHYLYSYSQEHFFYGFRNIDFDLINNMVQWCKREKCVRLIKDCYDTINKKVQSQNYDYWSNKKVYEYENSEIRQDFTTLYRDIQINQIL
jgi:hypothetical protein